MSLPSDYLKYLRRGYGQDHAYYSWRMAKDRPKLAWDNGAKTAISFIIPLEFFPLNPSGKPFKHPGAMQTAYPDLRHYTVRDYGNRVGVFRILEALELAGVKATFAINGEVARRYPPLIRAIQSAGHEIAAHGVSTDHLHHDAIGEAQEAALITHALDCFDRAPQGWLSPARTVSARTLDLLGAAGLSYTLDWEADQVPLMTSAGVTLIPNFYELSDFTLLQTRGQSEEAWIRQIIDAADLLASEHGRYGAQMLGVTLTPYVIGQPFRIWALGELLSQIKARGDIAIMTAGQIDQQFRAQQ